MADLTTDRLFEICGGGIELAENYELDENANLQNIASSDAGGTGLRSNRFLFPEKQFCFDFQDGKAGETLVSILSGNFSHFLFRPFWRYNPHMTDLVLDRPLTAKQLLFVEHLPLCNMNATDAYGKAYPKANRDSCGSAGTKLLSDPRIKALVEKMQAEKREHHAMKANDVLHHIFELATADPRELTEVWIGACRHCYGEGHLFQRKQAEYDRDFQSHISNKKLKDPDGINFDRQGGVGYLMRKDPNPECPNCEGLGQRHEVLKDTRLLSPAAARLYAGMKVGKDGAIEIKTRSQDKALELAGRTLGLFRDQVDLGGQRGPGAVPVPVVAFAAASPTEAAVLYQKLIGGAS